MSPPAATYALSRLAQHSASVRPGLAAAARAATASSLISAPVRSQVSSSADFTSRSLVYSRSRNTIWPAAAASRSLARAGTGPMTASLADRAAGPSGPGPDGRDAGRALLARTSSAASRADALPGRTSVSGASLRAFGT